MNMMKKTPATANFSTEESRMAYKKEVARDIRRKAMYGVDGVYDNAGNHYKNCETRNARYGLSNTTVNERARKGHSFPEQVGRNNVTPGRLAAHVCMGTKSPFLTQHPNTGYQEDRNGRGFYRVSGIQEKFKSLKELFDFFGIPKTWADMLLKEGYTVDDIVLPVVCKNTPKELDFMRLVETIPGGTPGKNSYHMVRLSSGAYVSSMPQVMDKLIPGKKPARQTIFQIMLKNACSCEEACLKYAVLNASRSDFRYSRYKQEKYGFEVIDGQERWLNPIDTVFGEPAYESFTQFANAFGMTAKEFADMIDKYATNRMPLRKCLKAQLTGKNIPKHRLDLLASNR